MSGDYQDVLDGYHDIISNKHLGGRAGIDVYIKSVDKLYEWQDVAKERGLL